MDKTDNNARRAVAYGAAGASGKGNTTLKNTVAAGVTILPIDDESNFHTGDKVVIGSGNSAEVREITAVDDDELTLDVPLTIGHAENEPVKELDLEIFLALECNQY